MYICVDYDGTCVKHTKPLSSTEKIPGAVETLIDLTNQGHQLILFTMRSNKNKSTILDEAVQWFKDNNIPLYGVQKNPTQWAWTDSPKAYGKIYIDDAALGCPLTQDNPDERPYVDWEKVRVLLVEKGILNPK